MALRRRERKERTVSPSENDTRQKSSTRDRSGPYFVATDLRNSVFASVFRASVNRTQAYPADDADVLLFQNLKQQVLRPDNEAAFCSPCYSLAASSSPIRREMLPSVLESDESAPDKAMEKNP
jgi:hypothetical protein